MAEKKELTRDEELRLDQLYRENRLLLKADDVREKRLQNAASRALVEKLENEIEKLKGELRKARGTAS